MAVADHRGRGYHGNVNTASVWMGTAVQLLQMVVKLACDSRVRLFCAKNTVMVNSIVGTAPGKVILFGEHAVVYGQPAIAVPIHKVKAHVQVEPTPPGSGLTLIAADLGQSVLVVDAPEDDPLAAMVRLVLVYLDAEAEVE